MCGVNKLQRWLFVADLQTFTFPDVTNTGSEDECAVILEFPLDPHVCVYTIGVALWRAVREVFGRNVKQKPTRYVLRCVASDDVILWYLHHWPHSVCILCVMGFLTVKQCWHIMTTSRYRSPMKPWVEKDQWKRFCPLRWDNSLLLLPRHCFLRSLIYPLIFFPTEYNTCFLHTQPLICLHHLGQSDI